MAKPEKSLVKKALEFYYTFAEAHRALFVFHDYRFVCETTATCKELAKAEDLSKEEYELPMVALILSELGTPIAKDTAITNPFLVNTFLEANEVLLRDREQILNYLAFLATNKNPLNAIEKVIRDAKDIYLALPDTLERLSLLRLEEEKLTGTVYTELEWLEQCKNNFLTHSFDTHFANREYGMQRSKNFIELERRIDKLKIELQKEKRNHTKGEGHTGLSSENEDLFKIAFRNYINLIALADSKAGLLIQVNSILASVVVALVLRKLETDILLYALPTACLLIGSAVTIFYSILASKPLENWVGKQADPDKEQFFFGSFDRLDPEFKGVPWDKYYKDMTSFFGGDKQVIFEDLIKESFEVRKVLSKKFGYLSIAYKVFFAGLVFSILGFVVVIIVDHNKNKATAGGPFNKSAYTKTYKVQ